MPAAMKAFPDAFAIILQQEGGFVNDARDPGGMTNLGVTARTWQAWSGQAPDESTMRALTPANVAPLYKAQYWDKIAGDHLPIALALAVFDFAVNAGPARAAKALQWCVAAPEDGAIGPHTLDLVHSFCAAPDGLKNLIIRFGGDRKDYYQSLKTFSVFGHGWLARVERVQQEALSWVG